MKRKFRNFLLVFVVAATPLVLGADRNERIRELSPKFICVCGGCNQLLSNCNHIGCASREGMLRDLGRQIDQGLDDGAVVTYFTDKYGESVLSAPPASGFNLAAWLMPFAALGIGAFTAIYFLRRFRAKWANVPQSEAGDLARYQDKVEEELKKFTPED